MLQIVHQRLDPVEHAIEGAGLLGKGAAERIDRQARGVIARDDGIGRSADRREAGRDQPAEEQARQRAEDRRERQRRAEQRPDALAQILDRFAFGDDGEPAAIRQRELGRARGL
ncbi:hypothetical protein QU38_00500, partial [Staphylococcus aureus]